MEQNHIINKVVIEVAVSNKEKADEIKDNISSFLAIDVFPQLEKHFNTVQSALSPTDTLQIQHLAINLDDSTSSLNTTLQNNILESLEKELLKTVKPALVKRQDTKTDSEVNLLNEDERMLNTFIHFIEKGYMPWWNSNEKTVTIFEPEVLKKIVSAKAFMAKVVYSLQKPKVQERIINQFTDHQIQQICLAVIKNKSLKIALDSPSVRHLLKQSLEDRKTLWSLILNALIISVSGDNPEEYIIKESSRTIPLLKAAEKQGAEEIIWKQITAVFPFIEHSENFTTLKNKNNKVRENGKDSKPQRKTSSPDNKQTALDTPQDKVTDAVNGYHVPNAGLVLIHPFMGNLFKHCNLIDPKTKKLTDPEVCAHLLHYIATGKTNQLESNMLFEKFLCNIPLNHSISRHIKLSSKHKSEAAKVIAAVQQNWSSMKTASEGLLQYEFFQRSGKLIIDTNQTLTIERKTQDILLDKLSWGIGFIKLPWQKQFIYVNW